MAKELITRDHGIDSFFNFTLDADNCDGTRIRAYEVVNHFFQQVDSDRLNTKIKASAVGSGRGSGHEGLCDELKK